MEIEHFVFWQKRLLCCVCACVCVRTVGDDRTALNGVKISQAHALHITDFLRHGSVDGVLNGSFYDCPVHRESADS